MERYRRLDELKSAIDRGEVDKTKLTGFICKGELFVRAGTTEDLFISYCGSTAAAVALCRILDITDIEQV